MISLTEQIHNLVNIYVYTHALWSICI